MATPFADLLATATATWDDTGGTWAAYNAAIATMFETVYDIVADQGDVGQTQVAFMGAPVDAGVTVGSLTVAELAVSIPAGTELLVVDANGVLWQDFTTTTLVNPGATVIPIQPATTIFGIELGDPVRSAFQPGWSSLLDVDDCPPQFLPYLAQFVGAIVPVGLDAATARARILSESAQHRGTLSSVTAAVTRNLSGTQSVVIQERIDANGNGSGYWFIIIVRPEEVKNGLQAIIDSVNAVKPGGVFFTVVQTDSWTISQMESYQATITLLETPAPPGFKTVTGLEQDLPGT